MDKALVLGTAATTMEVRVTVFTSIPSQTPYVAYLSVCQPTTAESIAANGAYLSYLSGYLSADE
jgi:hypothetical protein